MKENYSNRMVMGDWESNGLCFKLIFLFSFLAISNLSAQNSDKFKIPKINPESFQVENELIEENTLGYYLYHIGATTVMYDIGNSPTLRVTEMYRFRVLNEGAIHKADVAFALFKNKENAQSFINASGGVYNLVNGEVQFEKLRRSDWFVEEIDENHYLARISFKNVRVGSIIELEYVVDDPFYFKPDDWVFQHNDYPVLYGRFTFIHPDVMQYSLLKLGYHPLAESPIEQSTIYSSPNHVTGVEYRRKSYTFILRNIPGMVEEPIMDSKENYRAKIMIELKAFNVIGGSNYEYYSTWETAATEYLDNGYNAKYIKPNKKRDYFKCDSLETKLDSLTQIYTHIQSRFEVSDKLNYRTPSRGPKAVLASTKATQSEINWVFVSTLLANGIDAYPILYSKRSSERAYKEFALITQFTNVMSAVPDGESYLLMDPSSKSLAMGEISSWSMNGEGFVLKKENPEWVPLKSNFPSSQRAVFELTAGEGGVLKGKMKLRLEGIYANRVNRYLDDQTYNIEDLNHLLRLDKNMKITALYDSVIVQKQPLKISCDVEYTMEKFGDSYLLPAVFYDTQNANPLQGEKRLYPISFPDVWSESYTCLIHLDPGKFNLIAPDNANFALPDAAAKFSYSTSESMGNVVVRAKTKFNSSYFSPLGYPAVRQLYDLISTSHTSFIEIQEK